jgi:hypothetical protein
MAAKLYCLMYLTLKLTDIKAALVEQAKSVIFAT